MTAVKIQPERQIRLDLDAVSVHKIVCIPKCPCAPTDEPPSSEEHIEVLGKRGVFHCAKACCDVDLRAIIISRYGCAVYNHAELHLSNVSIGRADKFSGLNLIIT